MLVSMKCKEQTVFLEIHYLAKNKSHYLDSTKQIGKSLPLDNYCSE